MAFEENGQQFRRTFIATADLSGKQFYAITLGDVSTAAKATDGILQDKPVSGKAGCVQWDGISKAAISASQTLTAGTTLLEVDTGGTLKALASGIPVAKAMETLASVAAVRVIGVRLLPADGLYA